MWIILNEVELGRYLDVAIRDFNSVVGMIPAACVVRDTHSYSGYIWTLFQNPSFVEENDTTVRYGWMKVYHVRKLAFNEIYLLLYVGTTKAHGIRYVIENNTIRRHMKLVDGYRLPCLRINEPLQEFKTAW